MSRDPEMMQKDGAANLPIYRVAYPFLMVIKLNLQSRPSVFDGDCDSLVLAFHLFGEHVHKTCESNVPKWGGASNIRWMHCWRPTLM